MINLNKISCLSTFFNILFLFYSLNAFSSEYLNSYQKSNYKAAFRSAYKISVTSNEPKAKYVIKSILLNAFINSAKTDKNPLAKALGRVSITDGDTIKLGTIKVRLHGIDAPERRQNCKDAKNKAYACGRQSTAFLKSLVKNKEVKCEGKDKDRYGRIIGICYADEINLNSTMVKEGWAIAYRYYSKDYVKEEETAKRDKKGIWQGSFKEPYIWRKNN